MMTPGVPALFSSFEFPIQPVSLPLGAFAPGTRDYVQQDRLAMAIKNADAAKTELAAVQKQVANAPKVISLPKVESKPKPKPAPVKAFKVSDDFSKSNPEVWEVIGKGWQYKDGALHQTQSTQESQIVRLKQPLPRDFELLCKYTYIGGATYKSVTFRFDQTDDGNYANYVYTSAHAPGPKVQAAYTRNGKNTYPAEGRVAKPIKVGETYELKVAVRDLLVNVWLNGKFVLAYQLPDRQVGGRFCFSGFDAQVAFDSITIQNLAEDMKLTDAKNAAPTKPVPPATSLEIAQAKVIAMEAQVTSLRAIFAAETAKYQGTIKEEALKTLTIQAATAEANALKTLAEFEQLRDAQDAAKRKAAEGKLNQANQKLAAIKKGNASYTPIHASKKALETPAHKEGQYAAVYPKTSTGRRLALAKWMVSRENPLTARVAVNHVWMRHFGEPLVESVFDFGLRSERPIQAELLDFLAVELMESGWSFKHLHRLIVTSDAYQLTSSAVNADPDTLAADPQNLRYWRMNTRRMESQIVRDSLLKLSGTLDPKLGGPSLDVNSGSRRSLYFKHSRDQQDKFLTMFDDADLLQCYRRSESIVPQQALALSNSKLAIQLSEKIASRLAGSLKEPVRESFTKAAFELLLGRVPDQEELTACLAFCTNLKKVIPDANPDAAEAKIRARLVHALLNHNDFITIR